MTANSDMRHFMRLVEAAESHPSPAFIRALDDYLHCNWRHLSDDDQERIDKAFQAEMPTVGAVYGKRGISVESLDDLDPETDFINRKQLRFDRYISVTMSDTIAEMYMTAQEHPIQILFNIETKPNTRAIYVENYNDWTERGDDDADSEIIIDKGKVFDVADVQQEQLKYKSYDGDYITQYTVQLKEAD